MWKSLDAQFTVCVVEGPMWTDLCGCPRLTDHPAGKELTGAAQETQPDWVRLKGLRACRPISSFPGREMVQLKAREQVDRNLFRFSLCGQ